MSRMRRAEPVTATQTPGAGGFNAPGTSFTVQTQKTAMSETANIESQTNMQDTRKEGHASCCHGPHGCRGCITGNPCPSCLVRKASGDRAAQHKAVARGATGFAGFTLIELLIVIGLLGALTMLVLPRLQVTKTWAVDESMAPAEMMDIRRAYAAFQADCLPTANDMNLVGQYGLAILMTTNVALASNWSFPLEFDPNRGKGWRGPYLQQEGIRSVYIGEAGQPLTGSGSTAVIPVIHDPRHTTDKNSGFTAEHFYRVRKLTNALYLVYVGQDGALGTSDDVAQPLETP